MRRFFKILLLVFFLSLVDMYTLVIEKIPEKIVAFEGESISLQTIFVINIRKNDGETIETLATNGDKVSDEVGKTSLEVNLFNTIPIKNVDVEVIPKTKVVPVRKYCRS